MKYFGTDGFRGQVCEQLNPHHAFQIGRFLGAYLANVNSHKKKLIVGKDTRLSSDVLEHALASGAAASGCDVYLLGVCPTPAISYLVRYDEYDFGVMISASHNPFQDNGIKIFNQDGFKLEESVENKIETYMDGETEELPWAAGDLLGRIYDIHSSGLKSYANWMISLFPHDLSGIRILADLANGSATAAARQVLEKCRANVDVIANEPNGYNINTDCGSTHLHRLQDNIKTMQGKYDVGLAFDGDADRLLAIDEMGNIVDGDAIMYLCAKHLQQQKKLKDDTLVTTVMSNLGLYRSLEQIGIQTCQVQVGDKYVSQCMFANGYSLGGEQSGHIIFQEEAVSGDGLLTAMHLLEIMKLEGKPLSELVKEVQIFPQRLRNIKVTDKKTVMEDEEICELIADITKTLGKEGRILVRPSGTEQLIRVMVEAATDELCDNYVSAVIKMIEKKGL